MGLVGWRVVWRMIRAYGWLAVPWWVAGGVWAQDGLVPLPSGYQTPVVTGGTPLADLLDGWTFGAATSVYYDSNVRRGGGGAYGEEEDDIVFTLTPTVGYRTVGGDWFVAASGSLGWMHYLDTAPSDGYNIGATCQAGYAGPKLKASVTLNYSYNEGYNRYYGNAFISQHNLSLGMSAAYRLSAKTSFTAALRAHGLLPSGTQTNQTEGYGLDAGMRWRATPLIHLDAGIGFTQQSGDYQADRRTIGPYLGATYQLGEKVDLTGRVGLDLVEFDGAGASSDLFVPVSVALNYRASALWGADLALVRDVSAEGAVAGYRETFSVRAGYHRRLGRARWNLGASWQFDSYGGSGGGMRGERDYVVYDTSLSMPVLRGGATGSVFARYSEENGGGYGRSWDGYQLGVSLGASF